MNYTDVQNLQIFYKVYPKRWQNFINVGGKVYVNTKILFVNQIDVTYFKKTVSRSHTSPIIS